MPCTASLTVDLTWTLLATLRPLKLLKYITYTICAGSQALILAIVVWCKKMPKGRGGNLESTAHKRKEFIVC